MPFIEYHEVPACSGWDVAYGDAQKEQPLLENAMDIVHAYSERVFVDEVSTETRNEEHYRHMTRLLASYIVETNFRIERLSYCINRLENVLDVVKEALAAPDQLSQLDIQVLTNNRFHISECIRDAKILKTKAEQLVARVEKQFPDGNYLAPLEV